MKSLAHQQADRNNLSIRCEKYLFVRDDRFAACIEPIKPIAALCFH